MKKILVLLIIILSGQTALSSSVCSTDSFGKTRCKDSSGINSVSSTDSLGKTRTKYSNGISETCSTDSFGKTRCKS
ncbi:MAG: hypothetical protein ACRC54_02835, partial [Fusobacteriaceae bacterium]